MTLVNSYLGQLLVVAGIAIYTYMYMSITKYDRFYKKRIVSDESIASLLDHYTGYIICFERSDLRYDIGLIMSIESLLQPCHVIDVSHIQDEDQLDITKVRRLGVRSIPIIIYYENGEKMFEIADFLYHGFSKKELLTWLKDTLKDRGIHV